MPINNGEKLYVRVRAVTENGDMHPLKTVVPEDASVDWTILNTGDERSSLRYDKNKFDPVTQCVYLEIADDERKCGRKMLVNIFFRIYSYLLIY